MSNDQGNYPEHEKLSKLLPPRHQTDLSAFLEWIECHETLTMAEWSICGDILLPSGRSAESLIFEWLEIDPGVIERERRKMIADTLEARRNTNDMD